jgi:hypothetical protein
MCLRYILFFILVIISIGCVGKYHSQLEASYRVGDGHIGRLSILQPIQQNTNKLFFINAILMQNSDPATEGNLGVGYRFLKSSQVFGWYAYYDIRKTSYKNIVHQFTVGTEYLKEAFEIRLNGYIPITKKFVISSANKIGELTHDSTNVYIETFTVSEIERVFGGLDFEVGVTSKKNLLNLYLGGYYFSANARKIIGPQFRLESKPLNWLNLTIEFKHDKVRSYSFYAGLGIRLALGSKNKSPYDLESKMIQIPIRDIDAITATESEIDVQSKHQLTIVRSADEFRDAMNNQDKYIGIADDIDFGNTVVDTYGTKDNPIKGLYITGIDITIANGSITQISQEQKEIRNFILPNNPGTTININGDNKVIPIAILNAVEDGSIGYVRVNNWRSNIPGDRAAGLVGIAKGRTNIHHNTNLSNMVEKKAGLVGISTDNTIIQFNENSGRIGDGGAWIYSSGIAYIIADNSVVKNNQNIGNSDGRSSGIVQEAYGNSLIELNENKSNRSGFLSGGIVYKAYNNVTIQYNKNSSRVGQWGGGIISEANNSTIIKYNNNYGSVGGVAAAGIVSLLQNNSQVVSNRNHGRVINNRASGLVGKAENDSIIINNLNLGQISHINGGPVLEVRTHNTVMINNNYWQIHNDPTDRNLPVILTTPTFIQANGGALTRQELIDRGLI